MRALLSFSIPWSWAIALSIGLAIGACSYDPQFKDGTLRCSPSGECPQNYSCRVSDHTCVSGTGRGGNGGSGGSSGSGDSSGSGGGSGSGGSGPIAPVSQFIGTWTLAPSSTVTTVCANSPTPIVTMLSPVTDPSHMTITAGVPGQYDLDSAWLYPSLHLRVDDTGAHLSDTRSYTANGSGDVATQTWTATQFDILANTGSTAMHVAAYTRIDQYTAAAGGKAVTCMQMVSAPLTKP